MPITQGDLDLWFTYHAPKPWLGDIEAYQAIREAAKKLAEVILEHTPQVPDQTVAIRRVREAVMIANCARACGHNAGV
jgi:hypothetical protein